jgi:hypothetical protein
LLVPLNFRPYITPNGLNAMNDTDNNSDDHSSRSLRPHEELLIEAVKQDMLNYLNNIVDFSKAMITLVSAFFVAYFALFKFLGVETLSATNNSGAINGLVAAPILFILSLILFALSAAPLNLLKVSLGNLASLTEYRRRSLWIKYTPMIIGLGLFISGLFVTLNTSLILLVP